MINAVAEATIALCSLSKVVDRCIEVLQDPYATAESKGQADQVIKTANNLLARLKYVLDAEGADEMRKRHKEVGPLKTPVE